MEPFLDQTVPKKFEHWQIFHYDAKIIQFLNNLQEVLENQGKMKLRVGT